MMMLFLILVLCPHRPAIISVGDGRDYGRIEQAVMAAAPGDTIQVFRTTAGYHRVAVKVETAGLVIQGMGATPVALDGAGFDYSGAGRVPRAVFQIDSSASGTTIQNFDISGAHNGTFNGAGVRINAADGVTVRRCTIHNCDMGVMSNGSSATTGGANQLITRCDIHDNGNLGDPGFNHNLYLAGQSVTVRFCSIWRSLTGHNLKSRAHFTAVEYCYVHDSANREIDLVEDASTVRADSNALLLGNLIVKAPSCSGNRAVIQFGRERGSRTGTLYVINNSIVTPFASPVVAVTSPGCSTRLYNNVICNQTASRPVLLAGASGGSVIAASGLENWLSPGYVVDGTALQPKRQVYGMGRSASPFAGKSHVVDLQVAPAVAHWRNGAGQRFEAQVRYRYAGSGSWQLSNGNHIGA